MYLLYLGKLSKPKYPYKKIKHNHENLTERWDFDFKISICQSGTVHEGRWVNSLTIVGKLEASTVCWRESARRVHLSGNQAAVDRVRRVAVKDLVRSQEDKPKTHRSAREISHETAILRSSVHRIIHCDLQLKRFKRRRVLPLSEYNFLHLSSHSLINNVIVCNKSCYCSVIIVSCIISKQNNMVTILQLIS